MKTDRSKAFYYPLLATYMLWIIWCVVMRLYPAISDSENILRAIIRISAVLLPALFYVYQYYPNNKLGFLGLKNNKSGFLWGLLFSAALFLFNYAYLLIYLKAGYRIPKGVAMWANHIVVSPFAEEILFRVVVFQELAKRMKTWNAIFLSSLFFVLIHLPSMIILVPRPASNIGIGVPGFSFTKA